MSHINNGLKGLLKTVIVKEKARNTTKTEVLHLKVFMKEERN